MSIMSVGYDKELASAGVSPEGCLSVLEITNLQLKGQSGVFAKTYLNKNA